jgi:hypothetical protein
MNEGLHMSLDVDWAPDYVLADLRALIGDLSFPITLFHTHRTPEVARLLEIKGAECAIHPNFMNTSDPGGRLSELKKDFPAARGIRSHGLYYHSGLLPHFHRAGLDYFSNDLHFLEDGLRPHFDWSGMTRLPIYWEDDVHAIYFAGSYDLDALKLDRPGLKVFNFHPVHIFLNTSDMHDYLRIKPDLASEKGALRHRREGKGVRTLFLDLLRRMESVETSTLADAAGKFRRTHRYEGKFSEFLARSETGGGR